MNKPAGSLVVNSYVNEMARYGMFILSHFCIHKYTGAIAAVHLMRNIYLYVCIIRRWKICLEINRTLCT